MDPGVSNFTVHNGEIQLIFCSNKLIGEVIKGGCKHVGTRKVTPNQVKYLFDLHAQQLVLY